MDKERMNTPLVSREENLAYSRRRTMENGDTEPLNRLILNREESTKIKGSLFSEKIEKIKRILSNKGVVAFVTLSIIIGGGAAGITKLQHDSYVENTRVVETLDVPDFIDGDLDLKVQVQKDGTAFVVMEDGSKVSNYNYYSAEKIAELAGYDGELIDREAIYDQQFGHDVDSDESLEDGRHI